MRRQPSVCSFETLPCIIAPAPMHVEPDTEGHVGSLRPQGVDSRKRNRRLRAASIIEVTPKRTAVSAMASTLRAPMLDVGRRLRFREGGRGSGVGGGGSDRLELGLVRRALTVAPPHISTWGQNLRWKHAQTGTRASDYGPRNVPYPACMGEDHPRLTGIDRVAASNTCIPINDTSPDSTPYAVDSDG